MKMTNQQAEAACDKVQATAWSLNGRPTLDNGNWKIPFLYHGSPWQAFVKDRGITATSDEAAFIDEIERAVGLAIISLR
jgi:hypothetical protein